MIVIDPLVSTECAAAALALYSRPSRRAPVTAVIYTHSHVDHFGGVKGVVSAEDGTSGRVPSGHPPAFSSTRSPRTCWRARRCDGAPEYMFAPALERGPRGQVDAGIGKTTSSGTITLDPADPRGHATRARRSEIDGVRFVFQLVPDSEAPAEMNFDFPDLGVAVRGGECDALHAQRLDATRRPGARLVALVEVLR